MTAENNSNPNGQKSNQLSFSHSRITSQSTPSSERFYFRHSHIFVLHFNREIKFLMLFKMVTLKEYEAYLKVKRFIDGHDETEIISRLMGDNKYVPLIIESDDADPIKYYSTSAAAKHCGVTKQTLDYAHRNRCTRIVRRKGGVKEFRITWL